MESEECTWYDVGCGLEWLSEELKLIFQSIWESILNAIASVIEVIPVPGFMQDIANSSFQFPPEVLFWTDIFLIPFGISVYVSAITLRFIIRRLPIVG